MIRDSEPEPKRCQKSGAEAGQKWTSPTTLFLSPGLDLSGA